MTTGPERLGRYEYSPINVVYAEAPAFISGQTEYVRADLYERAVEALRPFVGVAELFKLGAPAETRVTLVVGPLEVAGRVTIGDLRRIAEVLGDVK